MTTHTIYLTSQESDDAAISIAVVLGSAAAITLKSCHVAALRMLHLRIMEASIIPTRSLTVVEPDAIAKEDALAAGGMDERNQTASTVHLRNEIIRQRDEFEKQLHELKDVQHILLENARLRTELAAAGPPEILVELDTLRKHCAELNQKLEVEQRKTAALRQALQGERVVRQELEGTSILDAATGKVVEKKT